MLRLCVRVRALCTDAAAVPAANSPSGSWLDRSSADSLVRTPPPPVCVCACRAAAGTVRRDWWSSWLRPCSCRRCWPSEACRAGTCCGTATGATTPSSAAESDCRWTHPPRAGRASGTWTWRQRRRRGKGKERGRAAASAAAAADPGGGTAKAISGRGGPATRRDGDGSAFEMG